MKTALPLIEIYALSGEKLPPEMRIQLRNAMQGLSILPTWKEYYSGLFSLPPYMKGLDQTTILINQKVVWLTQENQVDEINADWLVKNIKDTALASRKLKLRTILQMNFSFFAAVIIAFFPKCPFCWAAYMSIFSYIGLTSIPYRPWLLPFFVALFMVNLCVLFKNGKRHKFKPLLLAFSGVFLLLLNRLLWDMPFVAITGAIFLIMASLWNSLTPRITNSLYHYFQKSKLDILLIK